MVRPTEVDPLCSAGCLCSGLPLYLESIRIRAQHHLTHGDGFQGNVLLADDVQIGEKCVIGPNVAIGAGCVIGKGVRLKNCAVMSGTEIGDFAFCTDSLIGWRCVIGRWCRLENNCTFGERVLCKVIVDQMPFLRQGGVGVGRAYVQWRHCAPTQNPFTVRDAARDSFVMKRLMCFPKQRLQIYSL